MNDYIQKVKVSERGILAFQYNPLENYKNKTNFEFPIIKEYIYTKADLFDYLNVLNNKEITHSNQFWAGNIFFKKKYVYTKFSKTMVKYF